MVGLPEPEFASVSLNAIELDAPGRVTLNSYVLMDGAPRRRNNRVRPGVDGEYGGTAYKTTRDVSLEVYLDGRWDSAGTPAAEPIAAVASHLIYLRQNILDAVGDAEGSVACIVDSAVAGITHEGQVQVNDLVAEAGIGAQVVTFELTMIRGELDIVGGS